MTTWLRTRFEAQFYVGEEFRNSQRFLLRAQAIKGAEAQRDALEAGTPSAPFWEEIDG